jgi:hypothetical protein
MVEKLQLAPEVRKKLIPNVSLVIRHIVLFEECDELLLKRMSLMMFLLCGNIFCDRFSVRLAHTEDSISGLSWFSLKWRSDVLR